MWKLKLASKLGGSNIPGVPGSGLKFAKFARYSSAVSAIRKWSSLVFIVQNFCGVVRLCTWGVVWVKCVVICIHLCVSVTFARCGLLALRRESMCAHKCAFGAYLYLCLCYVRCCTCDVVVRMVRVVRVWCLWVTFILHSFASSRRSRCCFGQVVVYGYCLYGFGMYLYYLHFTFHSLSAHARFLMTTSTVIHHNRYAFYHYSAFLIPCVRCVLFIKTIIFLLFL